jgi:outer membrane protein OmpA-like peptidoglycan-associated protein
MRRLFLSPVIVVCLAIPAILAAQSQEDREGCKDSPLLSRLSGCYITSCGNSDFDAAELIMKVGGGSKHVEGKVEKIGYDCTGKTALQVRRNTEQALRAAGFTLDFTGYDVPVHYVTAHKGGLWIAVAANEMGSNSQYQFTSVLTGDMAQEMTSDAKAWAGEIDKSGRVAIYGIEFDTAKATLKPESEKVLSQVATLLNSQPAWKMRIEGHTDSTGTREGNRVLSQQRAAAVVAWLVKNGIAAGRLVPAGLGDAKPLADNGTAEGRARNRRVELVRQ